MTPNVQKWCPVCESWSDTVYRCSQTGCGRDLAGVDSETRRPPTSSESVEQDDGDLEEESADTTIDAAAMMSDWGVGTPQESQATQQHEGPVATGGVDVTDPTSTLPLAQLDALDPDERRRAARRRGLDWPSTDEARDQLQATINEVIRHEDQAVVDAPTSLGKTYTTAATRWGAREDLTGGQPVVHLAKTTDARDEAIADAKADGGRYFVLLGRHDACPLAAGDFDPPDDDDVDVDYRPITIDGESASVWLDRVCDGRGIPFSAAHCYLEEHHDQGGSLPCCQETDLPAQLAGVGVPPSDGECWAIKQWDHWREGDWPLVFATHNFAHVPGLRLGANVVIDERPSFVEDLSTDRVRRAVGAYLRAIDAPVATWEAFVQLSRNESVEGDAARERDQLQDAIDVEPDREWYFENDDAHLLAPALARAIFHAEQRANGRRVGKTPYEPPRLDANARDDDAWNREWLTVVLDETNDVRSARLAPDLSGARSVVGLDAHPALPVWQLNTVPWIQRKAVLDSEARRLWRRYERGLRVVQVGDATRPLASGEYFDDRGTRALAEHLRDRYGAGFRSAITAKSVEERVENIMDVAGVSDPRLMHFGEELSRNDFATESIGLVLGCIDPGDGYVLDLLAELDCDAEPERSDGECEHCEGDGCHECASTGHKRAHGRGFVGEDGATAQEVLAAVRESHVAQAAGRYARNPDDPDATATAFLRTNAMPPGFADVQVPGVEWTYSDKQRAVVEAVREADEPMTAREVALRTDVSQRHVKRTLERLGDNGVLDAVDEVGPNGATLYADDGLPHEGVVDLGEDRDEVRIGSTSTVVVSIAEPEVARPPDRAGRAADGPPSGGLYQWLDPPDVG